jgi:hypothetical protein
MLRRLAPQLVDGRQREAFQAAAHVGGRDPVHSGRLALRSEDLGQGVDIAAGIDEDSGFVAFREAETVLTESRLEGFSVIAGRP